MAQPSLWTRDGDNDPDGGQKLLDLLKDPFHSEVR